MIGMSGVHQAAAKAIAARELVVAGLDAGRSADEILEGLRHLGLPEGSARSFFESIRASWERSRRAARLVFLGRVHLWIGAIGMGLGAALFIMALKAARRLRIPDLLSAEFFRYALLPLVVIGVSGVLIVRGWAKFREAVRK